MLGIADPVIFAAYLLNILGALFCVIYGLIHWNSDDEPILPEDVTWAKDEDQAEEDL